VVQKQLPKESQATKYITCNVHDVVVIETERRKSRQPFESPWPDLYDVVVV
jgi:hypothetical protein